MDHKARKADHIRINLEEDVQFPRLTTGLERYRLVHQALPELDLAAVDISSGLLGKTLAAPLLISSMTGGVEQAERINRNLAAGAQARGIAMGLGSQRAGLEIAATVRSFQVRRDAPDILLLANLGAVQLNKGYSVEHCRRAVAMIEADALDSAPERAAGSLAGRRRLELERSAGQDRRGLSRRRCAGGDQGSGLGDQRQPGPPAG
ncbi:MAG: hypothetical protein V9H69_19885 [Anaerolineae bacterium]